MGKTYEMTRNKSKNQVSLKGNFVRPDIEGFYERNSDRPLYAEEDTSIWSVFDIILRFIPGLSVKHAFSISYDVFIGRLIWLRMPMG